LLLAGGGYIHVQGYDLDSQPLADPQTRPEQLELLQQGVQASRGRVLAVVTSHARIGAEGRRTGYELTELSRAYYVFVANGYEVEIASPLGGKPPMRLDDELIATDYAFLNDAQAQAKLANTLPLASVDPERYDAVYFVGGKGTMFDFPGNREIARIVRSIHRKGVIGAVCHGPVALVDIVLDDGRPLLQGRRATGFTNAEELFLIEDARAVFPFLLQDRMRARGVRYVEGPMYLDNTVIDGRLITGQNPWSTWSVAEAMIRALGHTPVPREKSSEEFAVEVLAAYAAHGREAAREIQKARPQADKRLLLMHALVAAMQWRLRDAYALQDLAHG
jgi:putative intracellular protease/amidase